MSTAHPHPAIAPALIGWFAENARDLPWRRPGFTAWGTLVSEFMLQQTPVSRVIPRLDEWLARWPTPAALAADSPGDAVRAWQSLGYPRRALWLHATAVAIVERHGGVVPREVDALLALPGVGDYTARAVAAFAYGERHPVVDTNIRRVIARAVAGQAEPAPPSIRRDLAAMSQLLPDEKVAARSFNAAIMELGATVCTARAPRCEACPISEYCEWRGAGFPGYDGPRKAVQKKYEGSDRQVRGLILAALRAAPDAAAPHALAPGTRPPEPPRPGPTSRHGSVTAADIAALWPDDEQRDRALAGLVSDGLAAVTATGYALP
ncbi:MULTISPECIES: A/G-specific adenine glycosylase [Subtercola]|uniref:Adenine DNA glycosylase n=1 Tax=Subtercola vilae TaxID=2056433 RepID=A0A4T2BK28_9MICO|nr:MULTISPECIES: A/G-specific adenine glycosylase [Subtercola]MEA9986731.1 A/G-specific adenine glycosylase [Subtercola sp. RTI3]TIH31189.1 A/G-specific adenine glycosylase [Subtercola vilae]